MNQKLYQINDSELANQSQTTDLTADSVKENDNKYKALRHVNFSNIDTDIPKNKVSAKTDAKKADKKVQFTNIVLKDKNTQEKEKLRCYQDEKLNIPLKLRDKMQTREDDYDLDTDEEMKDRGI